VSPGFGVEIIRIRSGGSNRSSLIAKVTTVTIVPPPNRKTINLENSRYGPPQVQYHVLLLQHKNSKHEFHRA
ncbi:MAG: hypothetical protein ABL888_22640, partial [Pirellulaceae bacterium]